MSDEISISAIGLIIVVAAVLASFVCLCVQMSCQTILVNKLRKEIDEQKRKEGDTAQVIVTALKKKLDKMVYEYIHTRVSPVCIQRTGDNTATLIACAPGDKSGTTIAELEVSYHTGGHCPYVLKIGGEVVLEGDSYFGSEIEILHWLRSHIVPVSRAAS